MFCEKCGAPNSDVNTNCVNCGAPMRGYQQPVNNGYAQPPYNGNVQQPYSGNVQQPYNGYAQSPYYGYAQPQTLQAPSGRKPTVLYIIAGVVAVLGLILVFLPQFFYTREGYAGFSHVYNIFGYATFINDASYGAANVDTDVRLGANVISTVCIVLFALPMALNVVWALLSFLQKRAAGVLGIIASLTMMTADAFWLVMIGIFVGAASDYSRETVGFTVVPFLILLLAIAGIPLAIVQLVKKKYL